MKKLALAATTAAIAVSTLAACGGSHPSAAACKTALTHNYVRTLSTGTKGSEPAACKGLPTAQIQKLAGQVVAAHLAAPSPSPSPSSSASADGCAQIAATLRQFAGDTPAQIQANLGELTSQVTEDDVNTPQGRLSADEFMLSADLREALQDASDPSAQSADAGRAVNDLKAIQRDCS